jgi:hypothetical protein
MKRVIVWAAVVACAAGGCSSATSTPPASTSHESEPTQPPQSVENVTKYVAERVNAFRPVVTEERRVCGGRGTIRQTNPVIAAKCKKALADVSAFARSIVFFLAHVGAPLELQQRVADTADAAGPVVVVHRNFPIADCLPSPSRSDPRANKCDRAGRELAALIAKLEKELAGWP